MKTLRNPIAVQDDLSGVRLIGEIDISNVDAFESGLISIAQWIKKDMVCDCSELSYIDSKGLGVFAQVHRILEGRGLRVIICNSKENISKLFKITRLNEKICFTNYFDADYYY